VGASAKLLYVEIISTEVGDRYRYTVTTYTYTVLDRLANLPQVSIIDNNYGHLRGRNGEFCVAAGPIIRTTGMMIQSVKGSGC